MPIVLRHFDVLTGEWIVLPNADPQTRQERPEVFLEETLNDTLLEAFTQRHFPNLPLDNTFSVAKISTTIDPQDLLPSSHPRRHALILTNGERAIYGPVEIRDFFHREINPDRLHNGAYGALFIGDCKHSYSGTATYLVVEDKTGENGGILPKELAYQLVGDSHGKVSAAFAREQWSDTHSHLLQFRLGDLTDDVYAKGVLAPKRMERYFGDNSLGKKVDFIIPTSSFKGKGKSTVQPGLYEDHQIWIGEKARSKAGGIRASQLLEDHPTALWDLLPQMEVTRERLLEVMQSPTLLAKYYCENYEAHRQKQEPNWVAPTSEEAGERYRSGREQRREFLEGDLAKEQVEYNEFLYHALKADPDFKMYGMPAFTGASHFCNKYKYLGKKGAITGRIEKK